MMPHCFIFVCVCVCVLFAKTDMIHRSDIGKNTFERARKILKLCIENSVSEAVEKLFGLYNDYI